MVKILALGDFHGKFQKKFERIIKKEKIDLIISIGDYLPFAYRKLWFEHCYGTNIELWEVIGKKKYKELVLKDLSEGEKVLKKLNSLEIPVFTVLGNVDNPNPDDVIDMDEVNKNRAHWKWEQERLNEFQKRIKKYPKIKRFDYSFEKFNDYILIGMRGHSFPGKVKSKAFKKHKLILEKLFKKFKKENQEGKVIFVSHNVPYNTKLDLVKSKNAHKRAKNKHYGSKLAKRIVMKFQPSLCLGGHIHESKGKQKIGKTLAINTGSSGHGEATIIEINKGKIKKVKLL